MDEVYRDSEYDRATRLPAACEIYERGVSLGVTSKSLGLAGLRIGWIATRDRGLLERIAEVKDYTTICNAAPSEFLAILALRHRDRILERNRALIATNLALIDSFVERNASRMSWVRPQATPIGFLRIHDSRGATAFCDDLLEKPACFYCPARSIRWKIRTCALVSAARSSTKASRNLRIIFDMKSRSVQAFLLLWTLILGSCAPNSAWSVMRVTQDALATQPHECIPLGWNVVPVVNHYFAPGTSVELTEEGIWIPAAWIGSVRQGRSTSDVRQIRTVLAALRKAALIQTREVGKSLQYRLTAEGLKYYYDENDYKNNPAHLSYLCYSHIVPVRVVWSSPVKSEQFRAGIAWQASPPAQWASDPVLRAHTVVLSPTSTTVVASFKKQGHQWYLQRLEEPGIGLPKVADPKAWTQQTH